MIIVLIGYMGSGKSTIGKELSKVLNYAFLDLDDYISDKESSSIVSIFKTKGKIYFRKIEAKYLRHIISNSNNLVLSLGGGTPCYANNIDFIESHSNVLSFYLKLSVSSLAKRLIKEKEKRPVISHLNSEEELIEFVSKHLFERITYYTKATYIINTNDKSKGAIIQDIIMQLI